MARSSANPAPVLVWFRDDLRLADNPALSAAADTGQPILCIYILDDESEGIRPLGGASRWWLHGALADLNERLEACGSRLSLLRGPGAATLDAVVRTVGASAVFWNRRYGAAERAVDEAAASALGQAGIEVQSFKATLLHEPGEVKSGTGAPYRVFSPYLKAALALGTGGAPLPAPRRLAAGPASQVPGQVDLDALALRPTKPDWAGGLRATWQPGEREAARLLQAFLRDGLARYSEHRNLPAVPGSSRLSPYLRFGEISPRQVITAAAQAAEAGDASHEMADKFVAEVMWRDFAYGLLALHPDLATRPVQRGFEHFPYRHVPEAELEAWRHGQTGYPIVDAGMRQLWTTGVMHNRVRMVTASFLVKHLLADWRIGEDWFWDTLCDADPANNPVNWQWVAGCGIDPAPYFRIFNPLRQGETYDPAGDYVRRFVPELARLPARWIHRPAEAPAKVLREAGVMLGDTYPKPIVEHGFARQRALQALATLRERLADQA